MKTSAFFALAVVGFLAMAGALCAADLAWQDDYDKALAKAKDEQRLVLLDFSATWCGPCRMMENTTFADQSVQKMLGDYVLVRVDIDRQPALADRYKVDAVPTCILLNQFGEMVDRRTGYANTDAFSAWVTASAKLPTATASEPKSAAVEGLVQYLSERIKQADPATRAKTPMSRPLVGSELSPGPAALDSAVTNLLAFYCGQIVRTDSAAVSLDADETAGNAKLVENAFRDFVQKHPALAAPYLNDPRLTVRILFTTLFAAANPGADFPFDPWAPAAERAAQAEAWSKRLAEH